MPALYQFTDLTKPDSGGHRYRFEPAADVVEVDSDALHDWCAQEFGPKGGPANSRWYAGQVIFWFRDKEDAFVFRLRWC